jgi:hypothetical protein
MSVTTTPRPADWLTVDEGQLYEGPEYRHDDDDHGIRLLWTPEGIRYGLATDTDISLLSRCELRRLRTAIDDALTAGDNLG